MRISAARVFLLLCLVISVPVGVAGICSVAAGQSTTDTSFNQTITIQLHSNGDATITLTQTTQFNSPADRAAFETLSEEFLHGNHEIGGTRIIALVDDVADSTDRTMAAINEHRNSTVTNDTGTLRHTFTWTNFGTASDNNLQIGDAFHLDGTHWLGNLSATQRLVIVPPDGYLIESSTQSVTNGQLVWSGPTSFAVGDSQATFADPSESGIDQQTILVAGGGIVLFGLLAALAWGYRGRFSTSSPQPNGGEHPPVAENTPETNTTPGSQSSEPNSPTDQPADSDMEDTGADTDVDPALLSDDEHVEWLLEQHGGRLKQATIVEETGWSSAKASQVLSEMDEEDRIDKLRVGRENLIALPDEEITDPTDEQ